MNSQTTLIKQAIQELLKYTVLADRYQYELRISATYGDRMSVTRETLQEQYDKVKTLVDQIT